MGFLDDHSNRLLGLENQKEASILIAAIDANSLKNNANQEQSAQEKILIHLLQKFIPFRQRKLIILKFGKLTPALNYSTMLRCPSGLITRGEVELTN